VASQLAVETVRTHLHAAARNPGLPLIGEPDPGVSPAANRLANAIRLANAAIHATAAGRPDWHGMGTTVIAAVVHDNILSFAHVGDSRLYLIRGGVIQALTTDHSWVAEQIQQGLMTEEEANRSPRRNIVTRALGVEPHVEVTLGELPVFDGDVFVLCSDGLTRCVDTGRILRVVTEAGEPAAITRRLVGLANDAGGEDNTTVITVAFRRPDHQGLWERLCARLAG
jgi:protein phosphatase